MAMLNNQMVYIYIHVYTLYIIVMLIVSIVISIWCFVTGITSVHFMRMLT